MSLELVLAMMADVGNEFDLFRVAKLARALDEREKHVARWAYAYAREELRMQEKGGEDG